MIMCNYGIHGYTHQQRVDVSYVVPIERPICISFVEARHAMYMCTATYCHAILIVCGILLTEGNRTKDI